MGGNSPHGEGSLQGMDSWKGGLFTHKVDDCAVYFFSGGGAAFLSETTKCFF